MKEAETRQPDETVGATEDGAATKSARAMAGGHDALICGALCYVLWGSLPLYWQLLGHVDAMVILCCRILCSTVFSFLLLVSTKQLGEVGAMLKSGKTMRYIAPAALFVTINWGVYIWGANAGHVLDASLGYYLNPLVVFLLGVALFREKCGVFGWVAIGLAAAGVAVAAFAYGAFPWVALTLAITFAIYGALKKRAGVGGLVGVAVETLLISPFAILYLLLAPAGKETLPLLDWRTILLLLSTGIVTPIPLILYARGVNGLHFTTMGFLQFISPTIMLLCGVFLLGEPFPRDRAMAFALIGAGLIVYTVGMLLSAKKKRTL